MHGVGLPERPTRACVPEVITTLWALTRFIFLWLRRVERTARNFLAFLLLSLFCASGGFFEGARRNGTIRIAQFNHF